MNVEDLLQTLKGAGMEDEAIAQLLQQALESLGSQEPTMTPEDEQAQAGKLLGVDF